MVYTVGNATFAKTTTTIDFAMTTVEQQNIFSVTSNSTLTQLAFDSVSSQLNFNVEGPSGTKGYVYVYIPKTLLSNTSRLIVWMDQNQLSPTIQSDGDSWLIYLTYNHSIHYITVDLTGETVTVDEFPYCNLILYAAVIGIAAVAIVALKRGRKKA